MKRIIILVGVFSFLFLGSEQMAKRGLTPFEEKEPDPFLTGLATLYSLLATSFTEGAVFFYQEPSQYVMAQANPAPAVKPVLDTSGIKIIQEIPVGKSDAFDGKRCIDALIEEYGEEELRELEFNLIPMELILNSIANLAVMQMGLERFVKVTSNPGEVIFEGEFGRVLEEILGVDPERDLGMSVEHTDFIQMPGGAEDYFKLTINCRDINLILMSDFGNSEQGYEWGVGGIVLSQYSEKRDQRGIPYTEEKELFIHKVEYALNPGQYKFVAFYTKRMLMPDGTLFKWEQWMFVEGSPGTVSYDKSGN